MSARPMATPLNTFVVPPYTLFDAMVSYDFGYLRPDMKGWTAQINATNLTDEYYVANCLTGLAYCGLGAAAPCSRHCKYARNKRQNDRASSRRSAAGAWVHKWTSLVCTVFLLLLCITGLPLIFHHEIDELLHERGGGRECRAGTPQAESRQGRRQRAWRKLPAGPAFPDLGPRRSRSCSSASARRSTPIRRTTACSRVDAHTAAVSRRAGRSRGSFTYIMFKLHVDMFAGLPGKLFLGLMGILFCVAIVSGVVVYAPSMRKLDFGTGAARAPARRALARPAQPARRRDVVWALVVGFTGVINTWADLVIKIWQFGQLAEMMAPYQRQAAADRARRGSSAPLTIARGRCRT